MRVWPKTGICRASALGCDRAGHERAGTRQWLHALGLSCARSGNKQQPERIAVQSFCGRCREHGIDGRQIIFSAEPLAERVVDVLQRRVGCLGRSRNDGHAELALGFDAIEIGEDVGACNHRGAFLAASRRGQTSPLEAIFRSRMPVPAFESRRDDGALGSHLRLKRGDRVEQLEN